MNADYWTTHHQARTAINTLIHDRRTTRTTRRCLLIALRWLDDAGSSQSIPTKHVPDLRGLAAREAARA